MPGQSGYAVGWGTLALINAGLAQGKGRSGATWFLLSVVLGPLATLMIVLLPLPPGLMTSAGVGGWHPQPFSRADWLVVGFVVAFLLLTLAAVAFRF